MPVEHLDLAAVLSVSQAVSGETDLEKLVPTILRLALEHADARRGLLILPRGDAYRIEAEASIGADAMTAAPRPSGMTAADLPQSAFRHVLRTREGLVLPDASAEHPFSDDEYVRRHRARSVLCMPLLRQTRLAGVIYLENNLASGVFTPARMALLRLLASEAAISLENARLYRDLRQREARVRRLVDANIIGIVIWHADGRVVDANEAFLGIIGHDHDDLVSGRMRWTDLTPPEWQGQSARAMEEVREAGAVRAREMELFRKDGARVPVMVGGAIFDEAPDEGVAFVLDLTERKRAEQAERELHERVAQRTRELAAINAELKKEVVERRRAEEALRASEHESRLIVDSIPGLVAVFGPGGELELVNRQILEYYGGTFDELKHWATGGGPIHPEDLPRAVEVFTRSIASGDPFEVEVRTRRFDGAYRWFQSRGFPLRDVNGRVVRWYNLLIDIDERKRAEAELRRAYDSFSDAQRLSRTGSFIADIVADDHIWSAELYRVFEIHPATSITVQMIRDLIHPEDLPTFDAGFARSLGGADFDLVFRIVTAGGNVKHARAVAHLTERVAGRPLFIGAIQDVTESKASEEALNRARSELAHVARIATMNTLTASIAHEVNQPLAGIITNAGTCLRMLDAVPPNLDGARETARRTIRDGNRAADVVARLRALFSKKEFTLEPMDLNEATREVIALSLSELQRNRVIFQPELANDLPPVAGDRVQLQQVILNLLRNAADAMDSVDDRPRQLVIRTERENDESVRLTVRDAGVGLDPESMAKVFDAFYTTKSGGMGIGLSISRSIVERHRGRLWAEPNKGPGATFSFTIPCAPGDATVIAGPPRPARHQ